MSKPSRRELRFSTIQEVIAEIDRLEQNGYQSAGAWNLSQICEHLADWMGFPIDGFPRAPWFVSMFLTMMRITQGKKLFARFIAEQRMPPGQPTAPSTQHLADEKKTSESVKRLKGAIDRLVNHRGQLHPSPLFGQLDHGKLIQLQLAHSAHHLSFLVPN
jgi:hypothetical protein